MSGGGLLTPHPGTDGGTRPLQRGRPNPPGQDHRPHRAGPSTSPVIAPHPRSWNTATPSSNPTTPGSCQATTPTPTGPGGGAGRHETRNGEQIMTKRRGCPRSPRTSPKPICGRTARSPSTPPSMRQGWIPTHIANRSDAEAQPRRPDRPSPSASPSPTMTTRCSIDSHPRAETRPPNPNGPPKPGRVIIKPVTATRVGAHAIQIAGTPLPPSTISPTPYGEAPAATPAPTR